MAMVGGKQFVNKLRSRVWAADRGRVGAGMGTVYYASSNLSGKQQRSLGFK
jgi:hypothetical protein